MSKLMSIIKSKWFVASALVVIAAITFAGQETVFMAKQYMMGDPVWDSTPKSVNGRTVFEEHFSMHPGHYSFAEKLGIATKVDVMKMIQMDPVERKKGFAEFSTIRSQSPVGEPAPDFELETTNGEILRLSDKRGRISVFMFVAMTCPPARTQIDLWSAIRSKYSEEEVDIFYVYSRERHAGERGYRDFAETTTTADRMRNAKLLAELTDVPIAVDPIDERTLTAYGMVPNAAFIVDRDGFLVFKSQWADVNKIEVVLDQLLFMSPHTDAMVEAT